MYIAYLVKYYLYNDIKLRYDTSIISTCPELLGHVITPISTAFLASSISTLQFIDLNTYTVNKPCCRWANKVHYTMFTCSLPEAVMWESPNCLNSKWKYVI